MRVLNVSGAFKSEGGGVCMSRVCQRACPGDACVRSVHARRVRVSDRQRRERRKRGGQWRERAWKVKCVRSSRRRRVVTSSIAKMDACRFIAALVSRSIRRAFTARVLHHATMPLAQCPQPISRRLRRHHGGHPWPHGSLLRNAQRYFGRVPPRGTRSSESHRAGGCRKLVGKTQAGA